MVVSFLRGLNVRVDDLDDALERVKLNGGSVWSGPMAIPDGQRIAQCADPQGATFALHGTDDGIQPSVRSRTGVTNVSR